MLNTNNAKLKNSQLSSKNKDQDLEKKENVKYDKIGQTTAMNFLIERMQCDDSNGQSCVFSRHQN